MRYLLCDNQNNYFGVPMDYVYELVKWTTLSPLPFNRPDLVGLLNLRGEVLPILNLSKAIDIGNSILSGKISYKYVVVSEVKEFRFGFEVGELHSIVELDPNRFQEINVVDNADTVPDERLVKQICEYEGKLVLILDLEKIVAASFKQDAQD